MTTSILHVCILVVVLCVSDGQSTTSEDSRCSYTFNVPAGGCGQRSAEDQFLKSSVMALQAQFKLLAGKQNEDIVNLRQESTRQKEDIVKLTDENIKLRQEMSTIKEGAVGGSNRSAVNLKQCSKRGMNEQKEYGLVFLCQFVKKRDDTVLRVVWNGDLRLIHSGDKYGSCRRWFFTINGLECREPRTIDTQLHAHAKGTNMHRPAYVEGYCRGIPAGDADVAWNVGDCSNVGRYKQESANIGDSYTGEDLQKSDYLKLVLETLGKAWVVFNGCPEGSTNEEADTSSALAAEADVSQGSQTGEVQLNTPIERGCKDSCHDTDKVTQCHGCCCSDSDTDISQGSDTMKELVCYGIGNFATSLIARYQLALFLIFRDELKVPAEDTYIYDPLLMSIEMSTLEELGCQQMALNEEGKRRVNVPTMFYMPHCGKALYNNLLWANWQPELLSLLTIVGNSFQHMLDSTPHRTLATEAAYVMEIQPYSTEFRLMNTFKHGDIFNNTSVHVFTHNALATAPLDLWTHSAEPSYDDTVEIIRN